MKTFFCLLGLILIIEGLPYFAFPDKMKKWVLTIQNIPENSLRIVGLLAMIIGILITYLCKE